MTKQKRADTALTTLRKLHQQLADLQTGPITPFGVVFYMMLTAECQMCGAMIEDLGIRDARIKEVARSIEDIIGNPGSVYSIFTSWVHDSSTATPSTMDMGSRIRRVSTWSALQLMANNIEQERATQAKKRVAPA